MDNSRAQWGSKLGFILAAAGSAIGLGNIWKFPGRAFEGGGGTYVLIYLCMVIFLGAPLMLTELSVGRASQANVVGAFRNLGHKRWSWVGWVGVIGAFIISAAQTGSGAIQIKGILWLLVAVISAAVFYVLSRSTADDFTPFERTFIMMLLGWVCFTAQAAAEHGKDFIPLMKSGLTDRGLMLPILYLSVLSSVVAFLLQNYSVTYLELARITVFENIIPVISVAAGVIFLGEPFSPVQLAGMALILLGVYKVTTSG